MALSDLDHTWGADLSASNTGDLATVSGSLRGQQRVLRRLMTNAADPVLGLPPDYIWEPEYGESLPRLIGQLGQAQEIASRCRSGMAKEAVVSQSPAPQITVIATAADPTAYEVSLAYVDAPTGEPVALTFTLSN
ncbi:MAG: phage tail protein [Steroidobacteraceae bacterium]